MGGSTESETVDSFDLDLRVRSVTVGVLLTLLVVLVVVGYCLITWERPHRDLLMVLAIGSAIVAAALTRLPIHRIVRSRWCEPFFAVWSFVNVVVVSLLVILDGTDESPLSVIYVMPLIFAASSYPLGLTLLVCVTNVGAALAVGLSDAGDAGQALVLTGVLAAAGVMCSLQARNHDRQREVLGRISRTDPLTDALNRRGLEERLEAALATAARTGERVGLLLLDLDGFKRINDRAGHAAGDRILVWTAQQVNALLRPGDAVGRIGGDEFAAVVQGVDTAAGKQLAERIAGALEERIGVSIGVASFPEDGVTVDDLHRSADDRLYSVKRVHRQAPANLSALLDPDKPLALYPFA